MLFWFLMHFLTFVFLLSQGLELQFATIPEMCDFWLRLLFICYINIYAENVTEHCAPRYYTVFHLISFHTFRVWKTHSAFFLWRLFLGIFGKLLYLINNNISFFSSVFLVSFIFNEFMPYLFIDIELTVGLNSEILSLLCFWLPYIQLDCRFNNKAQRTPQEKIGFSH